MSSPKSRAKLTRKGTMQQTIEDANNFLQEGTYDAEAVGTASSLGKRKVNPVTRYEPDSKPKSPTRKKQSRSKSPPRKVAKISTTKKRNIRSVSPKKKKAPKKTSTPSTPSPLGLEIPIEWEFKSDKPAFGVYVSQGKCWMSNDDGDVFGFNLEGKMERHIKLPSGIKSVVSDMGMWLYAGCDNGVVYDLSRESDPREAYHFKDFDANEEMITNVLEAGEETTDIAMNDTPKSRHFVFVIDKSSSMRGIRIQEVARNLRMIFDYHLREGDTVSLITFDSIVSTIFQRVAIGNNQKSKELKDYVFSSNFYNCQGCTAFFDALGEAWNEFSDQPDEEQWIITLTDGADNRSTKYDVVELCNVAKAKQANLICVFADGESSSYTQSLDQMCKHTKNGLFINTDPNTRTASGGITGAFKHIAQLLSSKVMWMDIRDGLLSVSDNVGRVVACSIEGNPIWQQKSEGTCGWMVRSDFEGVYHGHSSGVTKYSAVDGKLLWHVLDDTRVMFGWMDKTTKCLFVGANKYIYQISCSEGKMENTFSCDAPVVSTAATFGSERVFGADERGFIYAFEKEGSKRLWKLQTNRGAALSMHYSDDRLFIVTTLGYLLCVDVTPESVKKNLSEIKASKPKQAEIPNDITVTLPDRDIEETKDVGDGVVVEIFRQYSDADLVKISNHIHDPECSKFSLNGNEYSVENHSNGCRCVRIDGLLFIEQNKKKTSKYATRAAQGEKITWVCNSGKWGLVINDAVEYNGTRLLVRPAPNEKGFDTSKTVQFPTNLRADGARFVAEQLVLSESGAFYRIQGKLQKLVC